MEPAIGNRVPRPRELFPLSGGLTHHMAPCEAHIGTGVPELPACSRTCRVAGLRLQARTKTWEHCPRGRGARERKREEEDSMGGREE